MILLSTGGMLGASEVRDVLNVTSSCPPSARTQSIAWHASASCERHGAEPSLRPSSPIDTQNKLPDAYQFLEEVRTRLFVTTPTTEGASAATSPQQAEASPSAGHRLKTDRHAASLGSAPQGSSSGNERCSPAGQSFPSPCAAPQGRWPGLHAPASRRGPTLQALSKSVGKENLPAARASASTAAPQPGFGRRLQTPSQEPSRGRPTQDTSTPAQEAAASRLSPGRRLRASPRCSPQAIPAPAASTPALVAASNSSTPLPGAFPGFSPMQIDTQPPAAAPLPAMPSFLRKHAQAGPATEAGTPGQRLANGSARQDQSLTSSMSVSSSSMSALQHLASRAAQEAAASKGTNEQTANRVGSSSQKSSGTLARFRSPQPCQTP